MRRKSFLLLGTKCMLRKRRMVGGHVTWLWFVDWTRARSNSVTWFCLLIFHNCETWSAWAKLAASTVQSNHYTYETRCNQVVIQLGAYKSPIVIEIQSTVASTAIVLILVLSHVKAPRKATQDQSSTFGGDRLQLLTLWVYLPRLFDSSDSSHWSCAISSFKAWYMV